MAHIKALLFFAVLSLCNIGTTAQGKVSDYTTYFAAAKYKGSDILIIRKFTRNVSRYYLTVDAQTLNTAIISAAEVKPVESSLEQLSKNFAASPYFKALSYVNKQSFALQDAGIIHGYPKEKGVTLTIDLCPSHKSLDRIIFLSLINEFAKVEQPVPIALSISGKFMLTHKDDISWLKSLEAEKKIIITWVNHTYNHFYEPGLPLAENFLLKPDTNLDVEVLQNERLMIDNGLVPSVFFRFPGLVSDNSIVGKITAYGLIPIGSDAWLAKGQQANSGSIVLIHGNGNEPVGVKDFLKLLQSQKQAVMQKQWLLYDLSGAVDSEFKD
jgi:hypothetical protein